MDLFIFVLVKHLEGRLLNHMVCFFKKLPMLFSKVTLSFCTPISNIRDFRLYQKLIIVYYCRSFFNFSYYNESIVASQCDFDLHFPITLISNSAAFFGVHIHFKASQVAQR